MFFKMLLFLKIFLGICFSQIVIKEVKNNKLVHYDELFTVQIDFEISKDTSLKNISYILTDYGNSVSEGSIDTPINERPNSNFDSLTTVYTYKLSEMKLANRVNHDILLILYSGKHISKKAVSVYSMPGIVSLIPVLFLLVIAFATGQALIALGLGLFVSSSFVNGFNPFYGFLRMLDTYLILPLVDGDNIKVVLIAFFLSGLIGIIQKGGGALGLTKKIAKYSKTNESVQIAILAVGYLIFFDDFASIFITGPNMLNISDLMFVSREKFAFLVHATSSPLSSIMPISSWMGFELSLITQQIEKLNTKYGEDSFVIFMKSVPRCYFIILLNVFTIGLLLFKKDFGPMLKAQKRAYHQKVVCKAISSEKVNNPLEPEENTPQRWYNALIPIVLVAFVAITSLFLTGYYKIVQLKKEGNEYHPGFSLSTIVSKGDAFSSLIYSTFFAFLVSVVLFKFQKIMNFPKILEVFVEGIKDVVEALLILIFAWAIGKSYEHLGCAKYLGSIAQGSLNPSFIPLIVFLLSCIISFATGTSWGTMTVMFPLVIPLINSISKDTSDLYSSIGAIISGSVFGDMFGPISGTSVMASLVSQIPLKDHVSSQLPYGLTVLFISLITGYLPVGLKIYPYYVALIIGSALTLVTVYLLGSNVNDCTIDKCESITRCFKKSVSNINRKKKNINKSSSETNDTI